MNFSEQTFQHINGKFEVLLYCNNKKLMSFSDVCIWINSIQWFRVRWNNLWRQEEDILLLAAIHRYGLGDWKSISHFVGNGRTRSQCSQRWGRALDPKIAKIPWSKEEDDNLLKLVQEFGPHTWAKIARNMSSRSDVQCRYRYIQLMKKEHSSHLPVLGYQEEATSNSDESAKSPAGPNALNLMLQNEINKPQRIIFMSIPALLDWVFIKKFLGVRKSDGLFLDQKSQKAVNL